MIQRCAGRDAVVRLTLGFPRCFHRRHDSSPPRTRIRIRIGFGATIVRPDQGDEPDDPERGMDRRDDPAAVERRDRREVEEVEEEAGEGQRDEQLGVEVLAEAPDGRGAEAAEDRARDRDLRLVPGVVGQLLQHDHRAEKGDEHRRRDRQPLPLGLEDVAQLVDEQEHHEADRKLPAPEERVRGDRDEHRAGDREELELEDREQQELELPEEEAERGDRSPELAQDVPQGVGCLIGE